MAGNMNSPGGRPGEQQNPIPMRHLGELPQDTTDERHGGVESSDAAGDAASPGEQAQRSASNLSPPAEGQRQDRQERQDAGQDVERSSGFGNPEPHHTGPAHPPTAEVVGKSGGTDAAAGARQSGSKGPESGARAAAKDASGTPGTTTQGEQPADTPGSNPVGGTGLGAADSAGQSRTGTGGSNAGTPLGGTSRSDGSP